MVQNGSTSSLAPFLFGDLEADTETIGCSPDGYNINEKCGSTHPGKIGRKSCLKPKVILG